MPKRRDFLKTAAAGSAAVLTPFSALGSRKEDTTGFFGVHPFVENRPEAVFIMKTNVDVKTDSKAKLKAGLDFGRSIMVPVDEKDGGIPLTHKIAVKPNLTCRVRNHPKFTVERTMGIVTDADFVEGIIESMKELGFSGSQFYIREVSCPGDFETAGYGDPYNKGRNGIAERTGADIRDLSAPIGKISENDLQWRDVENGLFYNRLPYLWPINSPDTWLLNIAKFKAHGMGLTLCMKNLQGAIVHPYQTLCKPFANPKIRKKDINSDAKKFLMENYTRHRADGIPRWDRPSPDLTELSSWNSGLGMELWSSNTIDNHVATPAGLHIIEGIYGRDGNGFVNGPGPDGLATDYMTNIIIFGKNPAHVDIIGHWLGGHEPGNFGLFHLALERGFSSYLNPRNIPVYEWNPAGSAAILTPITDFERTPLKTLYLHRDFDGKNEPYYHLCDEAFDYGPAVNITKKKEP